MNRKRMAPAVALVVVLAAGGAWLALRPGSSAAGVLAASGTVEAREAALGFQLGGRIAEVLVREGDVVDAGDVLARLDATELDARLAAAEAQLAAARALLSELERGARPEEVAQARSTAEAARRRMEESARALERTRLLYDGGAVSREALDQAETAHAVAVAQYDQASEALAMIERGPRQERVEAQRAAVRQAEAAVAQVAALKEQATIVAPFSGVVTVRHREPGEVVGAGVPVVTLMDPNDRWVRIYVPEDAVGRVRIGQPARITSDAYRDRRYEGVVVYVASEAEFTPRNVQTPEERVKLVYAVRVRITGDPSHALKPGVPADVVLETDGV